MRTRISISLLLAGLALSGCQCGTSSIVTTYDPTKDRDAGMVVNTGGGGGTTPTGGGAGGGSGTLDTWCASDCDCPSGTKCVASENGELNFNTCQPGDGTCTVTCAGKCGPGMQCVAGACQLPPCVGTNCTTDFPVSVQGKYFTYYEFDIQDFAQQAAEIGQLLDLIGGLLSGKNVTCNQSSTQGQLFCFVGQIIAANIQAPPWVGQLFQVLSDAFKFGSKPIRAKGIMQLAENTTGQLYASETWSEMWLEFNGQLLNVMSGPQLGNNGQITVTVGAFGGTRSDTEVFLGPRDIEFDVNKLIVNLLGVMIGAATNNKAHDVGGLLSIILCDNLPSGVNGALCRTAASNFASMFELDVGLGGISLSQQRATIYDLDNNQIADALGLPTARGSAVGEMSNGFIDEPLGPFPGTSWYGTK